MRGRRMKGCVFLLIIILVGSSLLFLAVTRKHVPVHIDAEITRLTVKLAESKVSRERPLVQDMPVESITFTDFQPFEFRGQFSGLSTSQTISNINKLRLVPKDDMLASITLTGTLQLQKLIVGHQARVDIKRSLGFRIRDSNSYAVISMSGVVELEWEGCEAQISPTNLSHEFAGRSGKLNIRPSPEDVRSRHIKVRSRKALLNVYFTPQNSTTCILEEEIAVAKISFRQQRFSSSRRDLTTTIRQAKITLPTLSEQKPITLPDGSYLEVENLRDATLKRVEIDPSKSQISTTLYGYTNDLKGAYGRGELTQLLPASLIRLRQNALLIAIIGILLGVLKVTADLYNYWRIWRGEA